MDELSPSCWRVYDGSPPLNDDFSITRTGFTKAKFGGLHSTLAALGLEHQPTTLCPGQCIRPPHPKV